MKDTYKTKVDQDGFRDALKDITKQLENTPNNLQNIHTPFDLCHCIIDRLKGYESFEGKEFCVFNLEFIEVLCYDFGVPLEKIWFLTDCKEKAAIAMSSRYKGVNVMKEDFFETLKKKNEGKKFDVVVGNPPYQKANDSSQKLWPKFVEKSFEITKDNGFVAFITPSTWLNLTSKVGQTIKSKSIKHIDLDCSKYFDVGSSFSYYVVQNSPKSMSPTTVRFEGNKVSSINIDETSCFSSNINSLFVEKILKYVPKFSCIGIGKPWRSDSIGNISKSKDDDHTFPLFHTNTETLYSHAEHPYQNHKKVILNQCSTWKPFYSDEVGYTHLHVAIMVKSENEGKLLEKYLNNRVIRAFISVMDSYSGARTKDALYAIPKIDFQNEPSESELIRIFNLTTDEVKYIDELTR